MYTPVNPSFTIKSGVSGDQNYIGMFSWCIRDAMDEMQLLLVDKQEKYFNAIY